MTVEANVIEEIAAAIVGRIAPPIPLDVDLWSATEIGAYLKRDSRQVLERYAPLPGFPKAIRLPSPGGRGQPLWKAIEIIEWATKHQEGADGRAGRPRKAA
jgi:hypothetical protein